jgi:hypothetical protein
VLNLDLGMVVHDRVEPPQAALSLLESFHQSAGNQHPPAPLDAIGYEPGR